MEMTVTVCAIRWFVVINNDREITEVKPEGGQNDSRSTSRATAFANSDVSKPRCRNRAFIKRID